MMIIGIVLSSYKSAKVKTSPVLLIAQFHRIQHSLECKCHITAEIYVYEME